jgi:peptide/nickel transport system substrate-binding protein
VRPLYCEQLTNIARSGEIEPMLATEWAVDGTEWRFQLRPNVIFHDGSTMTADDVAFSLNRLLAGKEGLTVDVAASFKPFITSVEATGDLEITITTPFPDPLMPRRLASTSAYIVPRAYVEAQGDEVMSTRPVSAGPYRVVESDLRENIILERHSEYWMGTPAASRVILRVIPETSTRLAAFQAGEIDLMVNVPLDLIATIEGSSGLRVSNALLGNWMSAIFNAKTGPLSNIHLRRALSLGIDRQSIVDQLWLGLSEVMTDYFVPGEFGYQSGRPAYAYDPDAAQREIEAAGYAGEEIAFTPISSYYPNSELITPVMAEMWTALGLNINFAPLEAAAYGQQLFSGGLTSFIQSYGPVGDAFFFFQLWSSDSSPFRQHYYAPMEEFDQLWQANVTELDQDVRFANYRRMVDLFEADLPLTPIYRSVDSYGVREGILWEAHPNFAIDFRPGSLSLE